MNLLNRSRTFNIRKESHFIFVNIMRKLVQITLIALILPIISWTQDRKIKYTAEGTLSVIRVEGEQVQRLTKNVIFVQNTTNIYCDSSYYNRKRNTMEAFGNIRIIDDSVTITSKNLFYDGNARKAQLREKVLYTKGYQELTTDYLDYDIDNEISHYFNGGQLKDTTNTLQSDTGHFYAKQNYATFKTNVVLTSPTYVLKSENLYYNTITKIATTNSHTEIISNDGESKLFADGGEFRTELDQSIFENGQLETPNNFLEGDDLFFDQFEDYYKAEGNVKLIAKDKDVIITGNEGYNDETNEVSKIYGNPVMKRIMDELDTMYLSADTLVYVESKIDSLKRILAYNNVKLFKSNLQGYADSMAYFLADSMIYMYQDPIMWNNNNQIEADTLSIQISDSTIYKMFLRKNAFVTSEDEIQNYNQIKGRFMVAHFENGNIDLVDVDGNSEVIYYLLAEGDSVILGMNHILCSHMKLEFDGNDLENITAYKKPEAKLIPPHELESEDEELEGFQWQGKARPTLDLVLNNRSEKEQEIPNTQFSTDSSVDKKDIEQPKNVKTSIVEETDN